jgi:glyoxylase-like metal-dependent hydrolase (beta-lactamase superfamily II)
MRPVEEIQQVNARLFFWQGYEPAVKTDLSSHSLLTPHGWLIVDPIPLRDEPLGELLAQNPVAAIVLTNGNHERAAADFQKKCAAPVVAHVGAQGEFSVAVDRWIQDGDEVCGLAAIHLPGFAAGEIALYSPAERGTLLVGDALIHLPSHGFAMLPDKYCAAPKTARASLQKLLPLSFEVMTFAHGLPIVASAKKRLQDLLRDV